MNGSPNPWAGVFEVLQKDRHETEINAKKRECRACWLGFAAGLALAVLVNELLLWVLP